MALITAGNNLPFTLSLKKYVFCYKVECIFTMCLIVLLYLGLLHELAQTAVDHFRVLQKVQAG